MKELPEPEIYEKEFEFMPWGVLIDRILSMVEKEAPRDGSVLDLMCGPGYLLGEIAKRRGDLSLEGIDINNEFIQHAKRKYPGISFHVVDVLSWNSSKKYDLVLCTGGIHHLPYDRQARFLGTIPELLNPHAIVIFADPYVDDFSNELERKRASAKLGYEYMVAAMKRGAPDEIIKATVDILYNDVMGSEYKTSLKKIGPVFRRIFTNIQIIKMWPESDSEYGDYIIVCKNGKGT
jgi:2-polyprenyl-3-methyl-5-hydroxy-6-metoxy-1,4-benzoquinol methylase